MPIGSTPPTYNVNTSIIDPVTTQQFMDGEFNDAINYSSILRKMKQAGTIKTDGYGAYLTKNELVGLPSVTERGAATVRTFNTNQKRVNFVLPWTNIEATEAISRLDLQLNSGPAAKVNLTKRLLPDLGTGMKVGLYTRLLTYNAGANTVAGFTAQSGNPPVLGGLPTLFGYGSTAAAYAPGPNTSSGNWSAGIKEVLPNTTYYSQPTNPLAGQTPSTVTNFQTRALSPVITAYTSTAWTGTGTWASACREVINHHITRQTVDTGPGGAPDLGVMSPTMFTALINTLQAYYRISLEKGEVDPNLRIAGISNTEVPYGPLMINHDAYLTQEVFYCLNTTKMELDLFPTKKLIIDPTTGQTLESDEDSLFNIQTNYDIKEDAHLAAVSMVGQLFMRPKWHGMSYAAA